MYIITGACGFIGSNLVRYLNEQGRTDILAVDTDEKAATTQNLDELTVTECIGATEFRKRLAADDLPQSVQAILHQGACADTMETDETYMMDTNVTFSEEVLAFALARKIPLVYASSASVYGTNHETAETPQNEAPLNLYARSKLEFDNRLRPQLDGIASTVVGLRYFNVYGPQESSKGRMASMAYQLYRQVSTTGVARLFTGTDGFGDGEQRRDFIYVGDVAKINLFFAEGPVRKGIFNVGTGNSRSFNDVARAAIDRIGSGSIEYVPFPEVLQGKYQSFTEADLTQLRAVGYSEEFTSVENGIAIASPHWDREIAE